MPLDPLQTHHIKTRSVQEQIRRFYQAEQKIRIYHGSTNSTRAYNVSRSHSVDVSHLSDILEINEQAEYAVVEPNTALDKLLDATLKVGLMPAVVSEFPGITVGGAIQGGAAESSSFKWGCLHSTALEYEVVLANGDKIVADPENHKDLFYGMPCSYGTLGILTSVKLKLVPVTENIQLEYIKVKSHQEALDLMRSVAKTSPQFIDAIMFSAHKGVVMIGNLSTKEGSRVVSFHKATDEWFYLHAEAIIEQHDKLQETIPAKDYLFRYDRGAFWVGMHGFKMFHVPFNRVMRIWFSSLMKTRVLYRYLHGANLSQRFIIQDVCLPEERVLDFANYVGENIGIYPQWLCPIKPDDKSPLAPNYLDTGMVINVGLWGEAIRGYDQFVHKNRLLEHEIAALGGRKVLYAHTYYNPAEFWQTYDELNYNDLRKTYDAATVFTNIYEKVVVTQRLKASFIKGWMALLRSPF